MAKNNKIFTNQKIVKDSVHSRLVEVECGKCGQPVSMGMAFIDPYLKHLYVHYECLSDQRRKEIDNPGT